MLLEASLDMPSGSWSGSDFDYDRNGNQTRDMSRGVTAIEYNVLNLPARIEFADGGSIEYLYSAAGTKLAEIASGQGILPGKRRDYAGIFEYEDGEMVRIALASGYLTMADSIYHVYTSDYQGNIVAVYNSATGKRERYHDYYPYGMPHVEVSTSSTTPTFPGFGSGSGLGYGPIINPGTPTFPNATTTDDRRRFSSKELTTDHGLNAYDFAARWLAPALPRFSTVDRFAEKYSPISPYSYCAGDPINYTDQTGDSILVQIPNEQGEATTYHYNVELKQFIDANGQAYNGDNPLINSLLESLNQISSQPNGLNIIGSLSTSEKNVLVRARDHGKNGETESLSGNTVSCVFWNPQAKVYHNGDQLTSLIHELAHAYDRIMGTINEDIWIPKDSSMGIEKDILNAEKYATHIENLIRKEQGYNLRKQYIYDPNNHDVSKIVDDNMRSIYFNTLGQHNRNFSPFKAKDRYQY